jgi:dTDP-4-dehydrorhamnose 3,5-epimerase
MGSKLNIQNTRFNDLHTIEPIVHKDDRGGFYRVFCEDELKDIFKENSIKQINHSITNTKGTVRGMHFQYEPDTEVKIVKCIKGKVFDVVVDIRKDSKTFLKVFSIELSEENKKMIYIPKGFAHGFQTLEDNTELLYLHSSIYTPNNEGALNIKDPLLNINWPLDIINLSKRDTEHKFLDNNFKGIKVNEL